MTFSRIYETNGWNGIESLSGPGSSEAATRIIREQISELAKELGVRTTLDLACGDGYWMPDLPGYLGVDIAPEAIKIASKLHPDRWYMVGDIRRGDWHPRDLVIVRDVIQHMSLQDGLDTLYAIRATRSRWLLMSTFTDGQNTNIETGVDAYRPDMTAPPFNLGQPQRLIFDGYDYGTGTAARDPGQHLGLWLLSGAGRG